VAIPVADPAGDLCQKTLHTPVRRRSVERKLRTFDNPRGASTAEPLEPLTTKPVSSLSLRATSAGVWAIAGKLTAKMIDLGTFAMLTHF
jgi:hypothetical protein